jgi:hypothetical protein
VATQVFCIYISVLIQDSVNRHRKTTVPHVHGIMTPGLLVLSYENTQQLTERCDVEGNTSNSKFSTSITFL